MELSVQLAGHNPNGHASANEKHEGAKRSEQVHGFFPKSANKNYCEQIEKSIDKALEPKFGYSILALLMLHHLLPYPFKACLLGQHRDIPMHLAKNLYAFHHLALVGFKATVKIMKFNTGKQPNRSVEKLAGDGFGNGIVSFLLPPRHQVKTFLLNHPVKFRYLVGAILQVGIHCYHHIALNHLETGVQGSRLTVVAPKLNSVDKWKLSFKILNHILARIVATIIHKNNLKSEAMLGHHTVNPIYKLGKRFLLVKKGYYN